jgi:RNA polymerase sigma-70 factor (ECF subfamily)
VIPGVDQIQGEEQLIQSAQAGDPSAFEALYRSHVGRVYALCRRLSDSSEEAEDMTQETFIRAWRNLGSFQGRSRLTSWLHRVAVNVVLNARRVKGRSLAFEELPENPPAPDPSRAARPAYGRADLEAATGSLPEGARIVFVLHDVYGYVHREISKLAGCSVGTSKAQLHRARRLLREVLER